MMNINYSIIQVEEREGGREGRKKGDKEEREGVEGKEGERAGGRLATWINKSHDNLPGKLIHQRNLRELSTKSPKCSHHFPSSPIT